MDAAAAQLDLERQPRRLAILGAPEKTLVPRAVGREASGGVVSRATTTGSSRASSPVPDSIDGGEPDGVATGAALPGIPEHRPQARAELSGDPLARDRELDRRRLREPEPDRRGVTEAVAR